VHNYYEKLKGFISIWQKNEHVFEKLEFDKQVVVVAAATDCKTSVATIRHKMCIKILNMQI